MTLKPFVTLTFFFFLMALSALMSCKGKKASSKPQDIVKEWVGKEIKFPTGIPCSSVGRYTGCDFKLPKPYKILLYTDSTGCISCKLRIDLWKDLVAEVDTTLKDKVDFVFYFFPKDENLLNELMQRENFKPQIFIDKKDELNKMNQFPADMDYQCFLLDSNYKVVLIGNPTLNTKIWDLYKKIIKGEIKPDAKD